MLGYNLAVCGDGAAVGRRDAVLEAQIGSVFGAVAEAAPPQDCALFNDVVQPALADLLCGEFECVAVIGERAQEGKRAGDVVVGYDQQRFVRVRHSWFIVDVVPHLAQLTLDLVVPPALKRATEIYADNFPEHAGVDAGEVVFLYRHMFLLN